MLEIEAMITDPVTWLADYKVGELFRPITSAGDFSNFAIGTRKLLSCYSSVADGRRYL